MNWFFTMREERVDKIILPGLAIAPPLPPVFNTIAVKNPPHLSSHVHFKAW
jgi:hypothetical protein